jgi:hypothetical protein
VLPEVYEINEDTINVLDDQNDKEIAQESAMYESLDQAAREVFEQNRYRFERKLRGGLLPDLSGGYFIPESMIRELDISNGDILEIVDSRPYGDSTRYTFRVVEKGDGFDTNGRVEIKYCIVDSLNGYLCIQRDVHGEHLKLNGIPFSFVLKENDVQDLRLVKSDIVDVAYYENNPDTIKVVWKHDSSKVTPKSVQLKTKKENSKVQEKEEKELPIENSNLFIGKKILVVGAKPKEAGYRAILEALGSEVEVYAGTESKSRTRAAIQRSDAVVMVTAHLGHGRSSGSPQVVNMCKRARVPFGFVENMGNESFVRGVEEVLRRKEELTTV